VQRDDKHEVPTLLLRQNRNFISTAKTCLSRKGQNCNSISNNIVVQLQNCQNAFKYKGQNRKLFSNKIVLLLACLLALFKGQNNNSISNNIVVLLQNCQMKLLFCPFKKCQ
jgi:hypothetical protein